MMVAQSSFLRGPTSTGAGQSTRMRANTAPCALRNCERAKDTSAAVMRLELGYTQSRLHTFEADTKGYFKRQNPRACAACAAGAGINVNATQQSWAQCE